MDEILRVLKPGGEVYLDAPIHYHGHEMFIVGDVDRLRKLFDDNRWEGVVMQRWRKEHHPLDRFLPSAKVQQEWPIENVSYPAETLRKIHEEASAWLLTFRARKRPNQWGNKAHGKLGVSEKVNEKVPFGKSDGFRRCKLAVKRLIGREPRIGTDVQVPLARFAVWKVCPELLPRGGLVYSLGVGEDTDFDLAMIELKDMEVHAFDPTPASVAWLQQVQLPAGFHFHPWAVAEKDGSLTLYPRRLRDGSRSSNMYTFVPDAADEEGCVEVPAKTIASILKTLGHEHLDVLKMDIEGAEYGVLDDLLRSQIRPTQLLVEMHHRHAGLDKAQTVSAIGALRSAGYGVADISSSGREFTFILKSSLG